MAPIKCSVCGGTVINGRCSECGMTFKDESSRYHLNESREDHYRHATREVKREIDSYSRNTQSAQKSRSSGNAGNPWQNTQTWQQRGRTQTSGRTTEKPKKKFGLTQIVPLLLFFLIAGYVFSAFMFIINSKRNAVDNWEYELDVPEIPEAPELPEPGTEPDVYLEDDRVMPDGGGEKTLELTSGYYVVGCHIPEGTYTIEAPQSGNNSIALSLELIIHDVENGSQYYGLSPDASFFPRKMHEVKLFAGTTLEINVTGVDASLRFISENANLEMMARPAVNPNTEAFEFTSTVQAGVDFPAGLYHLTAERGNAEFTVEREGADTKTIYLSTWNPDEWKDNYKNLYLSEGTQITVTTSFENPLFSLTPSKEYYDILTEVWEK